MKRVSVGRTKRKDKDAGGNYFSSPKRGIEFISSGCKLLDLALGGGWAEGRIGNVIGDKSSGKTLLMIEAAANFALKHKNPKAKVLYRECESAFDAKYAEALGMPIDRVSFGDPIETIEDLFEDLTDTVAYLRKVKAPCLYIVDSLDALSDRSEMQRDMDQGTYGAEKAKKMSQLFRRLTSQMNDVNITLLIVSQVRSKIGVSFGRTTTRSAGRALDFYASQVLFIAQIGMIQKTISKIKRPVGIKARAKVDKNKVALPYREIDFNISFGYGLNDTSACLEWLKTIGSLDEVGIKASKIDRVVKELQNCGYEEYQQRMKKIHQVTERRWYEIEKSFLPKRAKYGG